MHLTSLQPLVRTQGGFASVCVDVSRDSEDADHRLRLHWRSVADALRDDGAPETLIDQVGERIAEPTGHGGELQRIVIATPNDVLLDTVSPLTTAQADYGHFGSLPHLMPLVRGWSTMSPYVLVTVDHTGADIVSVDATGLDSERWRSEGGHDVVHKVPGGGWSHRRYQSRVEDSWARNAEQAARNLDSVVAGHVGGPVFLVGDPYARSVVQATATGRVAERLVTWDTAAAPPEAPIGTSRSSSATSWQPPGGPRGSTSWPGSPSSDSDRAARPPGWPTWSMPPERLRWTPCCSWTARTPPIGCGPGRSRWRSVSRSRTSRPSVPIRPTRTDWTRSSCAR